MKEFRVVIAGGRTFNSYDWLIRTVDHMLQLKAKEYKIVIVCGRAKGADLLGRRYARLRNYEVLEMPADWDTYGKSAGYIRNEEMAKCSDATIAFWNGESRGTKHMIELTKEYKNQLKVVMYEE